MDHIEKDNPLPEDETLFTDLDSPQQRLYSPLLAQSKRLLHFLRYPAARLIALTTLSAILLILFLPDLIAISQPLFSSDSTTPTYQQPQACTISIAANTTTGSTYQRGEISWQVRQPANATPTVMCGNRQGQQKCIISGGSINEASTNPDDNTWQFISPSGTPQTIKCR